MPFIKKIELKSFKSFGPKKISVNLEKGLTVFTGPNGSGKTNIVDAILFGLGELSTRRLRAESSSKLIFHGAPSAGIEKARSAKVVIQFDNSSQRIPVDTSTVTISREVRRDGKSIYRLNGRRISRTRISDILSMAGISSTGHNIILQGTITRLADVSSTQRRKVVEDLVGIAQYDSEKAEAEGKLREAEISVQTAMGRIDEVQQRVDDLEKERNDLLRHTFIQKEVKRFEATKVSHEVSGIERKMKDLSSKKDGGSVKVEKFRQLREELRSKRNEVTTEWLSLGSEMLEEGESRLLGTQIKIGDLKSRLTELTTKIGVGTTSLASLRKVRENTSKRYEKIREEMGASRKEAKKLKLRHNRLSKERAIKQAQRDAIFKETSDLWANIDENNKKIREIEKKIDSIYRGLLALQNDRVKSQTNLKVLSRRQRDVDSQKEKSRSTLNELETSLVELQKLQKEQKSRIKDLQQTLERRIIHRTSITKEIAEASKIAESAREAVVEFATQRELAETVAGEERALTNIEELGNLGVIQGIYGRLKNLVKIEKRYKRAIEAAAAGWLNSLVVKDFDTAFTCAETLKRLKLGRIKIFPIQGLSINEPTNIPEIEGVTGSAPMFIKYAERYKPAITFIFGDTVVSKNVKSAIIASRVGYRTVTVNGDLYEAGGGIESGYYRAPIDFSTIIPTENAVNSLDQAVQALQENLLKRGKDMTFFDEDVNKTQVEIARLVEFINTLESGITRAKRNIRRVKRNTKRFQDYVEATQGRIDKEKTQMGIRRAQRRALVREMKSLRSELFELRRKTDRSQIQEIEAQRAKFEEEIQELRQTLGNIKVELSTIRSKSENVLKTASNNFKIQIGKVKQQISSVEGEIKEAIPLKDKLENELSEALSSKNEMVKSLLTARKDAKKFTFQIEDIDKQLYRLDTEYEDANRLLNQIQLDLQTSKLHFEQRLTRLKELGYEEALKFSPEQLEAAKSSLKLMRFELERLGAINQLALTRYAEQISRYREISIRMNELELEKRAIVSFINEVERKKREVFMDAFNKTNENLKKHFSKLTGGGEATLKLINPEEPFSGGIDMIVSFPAKHPIIVSGASGGERSVATVAFVLAIQDFMPASFYLLDEVDAHLDPFHVAKLGELLVEESQKSQFLVVTLKHKLVSKAERVYGVYERNGVSNVVSTIIKGVS